MTTDLRTELEKWATRIGPWTGPASMTAEDGYNAAIEEVVGMLNYHRPEPARSSDGDFVERLADAMVVAFREVALRHHPGMNGDGWPSYAEHGADTGALVVTELARAIAVRLPALEPVA